MNPLCLLSYAWHRSENQSTVSANNCHSSPLIFIYQSHVTEKALLSSMNFQTDSNKTGVSSYFSSLRIQRVIHAPHMQSKFRVPHEETWTFSPSRFTDCSRAIIPKLHWHRGDNQVTFFLTCTKQEHKMQGSFSHGQFLISFLFCAS